jgi:hypothetical protein
MTLAVRVSGIWKTKPNPLEKSHYMVWYVHLYVDSP